MNTRMLAWSAVILWLALIPALMTGCGADDSDSAQHNAIYTIGPGALEHFPASWTYNR